MSLLGDMFMGAVGGMGQAALKVGENGMLKKREQALQKMRDLNSKLDRESRERTEAARIASAQMEGQADRDNRLEVAKIQSIPTSSGKLDPRISSMISDIDSQLKPLYETEYELTPEQRARMQQLQQQRVVLLGGGLPSFDQAAPKANPGPDKTETGTKGPGQKLTPGLLEMSQNPPVPTEDTSPAANPAEAMQKAQRLVKLTMGEELDVTNPRHQTFMSKNYPALWKQVSTASRPQ